MLRSSDLGGENPEKPRKRVMTGRGAAGINKLAVLGR